MQKTLNKKLDLISRITPNKTSKDYNTISNNLDSSTQELKFLFKYLRHLTSLQISSPPHDNQPKTHAAQVNRYIENDTTISDYARQCEYLNTKISNKSALVKDFENFSQLLIDKIKHLQEENENLKVKIQSSQQYSHHYQATDKFGYNNNEQKLNSIIESIEELKRNQDVFNAKLDYLNNCRVNFENECYNKEQQEIGNQWKEMRKMNEDINLLTKESTKMKLSEEIKLNELKLQMRKLETQIPNQYDNEIETYEEENIK